MAADSRNLRRLTIGDTTLYVKNYDEGDYVHLEYFNPEYDLIKLEVDTIIDSIADFNLANATLTNKVLWSPTDSGLFIGTISASFTANANGVRYINAVSLNPDDISDWSTLGARQRLSAASSGETHLSATIAVKVDTTMNIGARLYQNCGSALQVKDFNIRGILIKR